MDFPEYKQLIKNLKHGKSLPTAVYLHKSCIAECLPEALSALINTTIKALEIEIDADWNLIKLYKRDFKFTLLEYPSFDQSSYPELLKSHTIDIYENTVKTTDYSSSANPPILHRKETFVLPNYPNYKLFEELTKEGEQIDLLSKHQKYWLQKAMAKLNKMQRLQVR
ncbi:hypothetical protein [Pseudoalteromonas sp. GB43]